MNRDALLVGVGCLLAIIAGGWLFLASMTAAPSEERPVTVSFSVIDRGESAGVVTERKNYSIKNTEEFQEVWRMVYGDAAPSLPSVDFSQDQVLAVFDETHTTGGYGVSITTIEDTGLRRFVHIVHTEPGEGCIVSQAITSPFEMIVLPKSDAVIAREDIVQKVDCP